MHNRPFWAIGLTGKTDCPTPTCTRPPGTAMHLFYEYLQAKHPACLDFASHSPYLQMRQWLAEDCEP